MKSRVLKLYGCSKLSNADIGCHLSRDADTTKKNSRINYAEISLLYYLDKVVSHDSVVTVRRTFKFQIF